MKPPWRSVLACAVGLTFSMAPIYVQTFGLFVKPMGAELGWDRAQLSLTISVGALAMMVVSPLVGRMIDKHGGRSIILISTLCFSLSLASLYFIPDNLLVYLILSLIIGAFGTGGSTFVYVSVLARWFKTGLGLALAFCSIGFGLGQSVMPLYANWLLQELGWRQTYVALGLTVFLVTVPNTLFLIKDAPRKTADQENSNLADDRGISHRAALRRPAFWYIVISILLVSMATTGCMVHLAPLLTDRGLSATQAASALALMGVSTLCGRFVLSILLDYVSALWLGLANFVACAIGILLIASGNFRGAVEVGVILVALCIGAEGDLMPFVVRRVFGMQSYSTIYGYVFGASIAGLMVGPPALGFSFDSLKSYTLGMQILAGLSCVAAVLWVRGVSVCSMQGATQGGVGLTVRSK